MAGRFIVLYSLPSPAGSAESPVIISKGELMMDRFSEKMYIRVWLESVDEREIHSVQLRLQLFDEVGTPIEPVQDYSFHSLKVIRDESFGEKRFIEIPNKNARSFSAFLTNVTFADYSYWENELPFQGFGRLQTLEEAFGNKALAKQFEAQYGNDCQYMPSDETIIWYCACGAINRSDEERCHLCRRKRTALKEVNYHLLEKKAEEHSNEDETKQINGEEQAEKRKTGRKLLKAGLFLLPLLLVLVLLLSTVPPFLERQNTYQEAEQALNKHEFDEAQALFESLDNYRDSKEKIEKEIPYQKALILIEASKNEDEPVMPIFAKNTLDSNYGDLRMTLLHEAKEQLEALLPYKDSADLLNEIQEEIEADEEKNRADEYSRADALLEKGAYLQARDAFLAMGSYKDAADYTKECLYRRAISVLNFCENSNVRNISIIISHNVEDNTLISMPGTVLTELGSDTIYELKKCFVEDGVEFLYEDTPSGDNYLPICDALAAEFEGLGDYKDSQDFKKRALTAGDFSQEFYRLLREGELDEAVRWLHKYSNDISNSDQYIEWIGNLQELCSEWELAIGDSTLIPFSAGEEYTRLELFETTITVENDFASIHIIPEDYSYEVELKADFGKTQFSWETDSGIYYSYINQVGRLVYIRYSQNGAVLSSCEYSRR